MSTVTDRIGSMLAKIAHRYNPENDVPSGPPVTWAEEDLRYAVMRLANEIDSLRKRIAQLESRDNE